MEMDERYRQLFGGFDMEKLRGHTNSMLLAAGSMKNRLGEQAYLVDEHIFTIAKGFCVKNATTVADDGFRAYSNLHQLVADVLEGGSKHAQHPFFPAAKEFVVTHPLPYRRETLRLVYTIALADQYLEHHISEPVRTAVNLLGGMDVDIVRFSDIHEEIAAALGSVETLDLLETHLLSRFRVASYMDLYIQGFSSNMLFDCIARDIQTQKPAFQLWLESGIGVVR